MQKVGFIGVFLLPQVKSSMSCHPHVSLVKEEEKCLKDLQLFKSLKATENISVYCNGMWDALNCWPPASLGETVSQPCPNVFSSAGKVHRNCTADGWTDLLVPHEDACGYTFNGSFLEEPADSHLYYSYVKTMYTAGYTLSLVSLTIAITIFSLFRKLHCTRNHIHIQLFVSFILRAIFIFIRDSLLFTNKELYHCDDYPVGCKIVLMFSNYSILANYSWLLVEGHFLFILVSRSFFSLKKHLAWYILLSWGCPLIVIISWGCAKYFYEDEGCWETRRHKWIWWILRVPVLLTICVNLIFFLGILRILVDKLRMPDAQRNEFSQYKRLIKSTFFLVALFGLHYILFVFLPVEFSSSVFKIWMFAELALSSTQGFVVAVLYCFMNGEVQQELKRRWRRWRLIQHLPSRRRQHRGSFSNSGSPHTQVSLLPCSPGSLVTRGLPVDTLEL
ncbi:secretin receptor isoform X1 [Austrofundulus limnaeus]|uniref:Secretin receptor isoform X1 n=1 Tax=Austrofundulus limnaeus TaxID=52670 RepID=A0A2I4BEE5_AUSLI|nr:PREDICTED: secretin receptor isoform X1 [Austrofundulus limnaeus]XP_013866108.1 PREDICTED: secretin receptor isoform X1 [Austrofundulus limnaeus]